VKELKFTVRILTPLRIFLTLTVPSKNNRCQKTSAKKLLGKAVWKARFSKNEFYREISRFCQNPAFCGVIFISVFSISAFQLYPTSPFPPQPPFPRPPVSAKASTGRPV